MTGVVCCCLFVAWLFVSWLVGWLVGWLVLASCRVSALK